MKKRSRKTPAENKKIKPVMLSQFGKRLKQLRKAAGYTSQLTFAYEYGFNHVQYNKWERGEDIKLSNIARLCEAFEIPVQELFGEGFE